jgi:hypothetical protein
MIHRLVYKYKKPLIGTLLGAMAGFLYYYFIGCANGSCMIASNPLVSVPYGAILGFLLSGSIKKKEHETS